MKDKIKDLKLKFIGDDSWIKFKDFLILKLIETRNEEEFTKLMETILGAMFGNVKELEKTRKAMNLKLLNEAEKRNIDKFLKEKEEKK